MKTSKKDFNYFVRYCEEWQSTFGLNHWRIDYKHGHIDDAYAATYLGDKYAVLVKLATQWDVSPTKKQLQRCAKHEMLHVLLGRITHYATQRYVTKQEIASATEEAIVSIESYIDGRTIGVMK